MAGDWIKMTHALPDKPEVLAIAGKAGLNRFDVVGRLFILWRWFDVHTTDGNAVGVTEVTLEECLFGYGANAGFVAAVVSVGWLDVREGGIGVVKFDEHISESAKVRAQTAKRVAKSKSNAKGNAEGNGESVTKTVPREEKRREEKKDIQALPEWVPSDAWDGYIQARKQMRKPMTDRAKKLLLGELTKLREQGHDPANLLDTATAKNWLSVYPPKGEGNRTRSGVAL